MSIDSYSDLQHAFEQLLGTDCGYCADGELIEGTYKGDRAVLCADCETPALRDL